MVRHFKKFFEIFLVIIMLLVYPVISARWYRHCRIKKSNEAQKSIVFGVLGIVGIIGFIIAINFVNGLVWLVSGIFYLIGLKLQLDLIMKINKRRVHYG